MGSLPHAWTRAWDALFTLLIRSNMSYETRMVRLVRQGPCDCRDVRVGPNRIAKIRKWNRRVIRLSSVWLNSLGLQTTPPLAPPNGTSTNAAFQVIHPDRTSSTVTAGW